MVPLQVFFGRGDILKLHLSKWYDHFSLHLSCKHIQAGKETLCFMMVWRQVPCGTFTVFGMNLRGTYNNRSFSLDLVEIWTGICKLTDPLISTKCPKTSPYDANLKMGGHYQACRAHGTLMYAVLPPNQWKLMHLLYINSSLINL